MRQNAFAAKALSRTPLWELTALPQNPLAGFRGSSEEGRGRKGRKRKGREREQKFWLRPWYAVCDIIHCCIYIVKCERTEDDRRIV